MFALTAFNFQMINAPLPSDPSARPSKLVTQSQLPTVPTKAARCHQRLKSFCSSSPSSAKFPSSIKGKPDAPCKKAFGTASMQVPDPALQPLDAELSDFHDRGAVIHRHAPEVRIS